MVATKRRMNKEKKPNNKSERYQMNEKKRKEKLALRLNH